MKFMLLAGCLLLVLALPVVQSVSGDKPNWNLHVDLVDGSRVVGRPVNSDLRVDIGFDKLEIPLKRIRRAEWQRDGRTVRIELANQDVLSGEVIAEPVELATIFGKVTLSMNHFRALEVLPVNPYGWLPTTRGLVAYYNFDSDESGQCRNSAADKHHGSIEGAQWTELGRRGGAIDFKGSSQITIPHDLELCPSTLSVAAWVYPRGNRGNYAVILGKSHGGSWSGGYGLVYMSGDQQHIHFYINGYTDSVAKAEVPSNKWSHLAGVCDGETVKMYLNGEQVESTPLRHNASVPSGPSGSSRIAHTQTPLILGSDTSGYRWDGKLDEVALYSRPLSASEIRRLYQTGATLPAAE